MLNGLAKNTRESNFELLRIVAMTFIVVHHFLIATGKVDYFHAGRYGGEFANSFLVCGVNCFILISGYFGIKLRASGFFKFVFTILFVALVETVLASVSGISHYFNLRYAIHRIIPVFSDSNWFVPSYIGLMLVSPVLNKATSNASQKELTAWAAIVAALNFYAYAFSITPVNSTGYNLFHFISLYVFGQFFRRVPSRCNGFAALAIYIASSVAAYIVSLLVAPGFTAYSYNSPQILVASCGLFVFFSKIRLRSRVVNLIASGMFCVFLFHYSIIYNLKDGYTALEVVCVFLVAFLGGTLIGLAANRLWRMVWNMLPTQRR